MANRITNSKSITPQNLNPIKTIWLVGWSLTVLSGHFRSYRAFEVGLYYIKIL